MECNIYSVEYFLFIGERISLLITKSERGKISEIKVNAIPISCLDV